MGQITRCDNSKRSLEMAWSSIWRCRYKWRWKTHWCRACCCLQEKMKEIGFRIDFVTPFHLASAIEGRCCRSVDLLHVYLSLSPLFVGQPKLRRLLVASSYHSHWKFSDCSVWESNRRRMAKKGMWTWAKKTENWPKAAGHRKFIALIPFPPRL